MRFWIKFYEWEIKYSNKLLAIWFVICENPRRLLHRENFITVEALYWHFITIRIANFCCTFLTSTRKFLLRRTGSSMHLWKVLGYDFQPRGNYFKTRSLLSVPKFDSGGESFIRWNRLWFHGGFLSISADIAAASLTERSQPRSAERKAIMSKSRKNRLSLEHRSHYPKDEDEFNIKEGKFWN